MSLSKIKREPSDDKIVFDFLKEKLLRLINYPISKWDSILPTLANSFIYEKILQEKMVFQKSNFIHKLTNLKMTQLISSISSLKERFLF